MKRIAYEIIHEHSEKALGYIGATLSAFLDAGIDCCTLSLPGAAVPKLAGVRCLEGETEVLLDDVTAQAPLYDEVWLLSDCLMGPMLPLQGLAEHVESTGHLDGWYLAHGSEFYAVSTHALSQIPLAGWLNSGMTEAGFLHMLQVRGLIAEELYDTTELSGLSDVPMLDYPRRLMEEMGCPFFLHEVFHRPYGEVIGTTLGHMGQQLYDYLHNVLHADLNPLWDYLLATCHQEDLYWNLHLQYTLSTDTAPESAVHEHLQTHRLALTMHLYYTDMLPQSKAYADCFPPETDVLITTNSEEKKAIIEQVFAGSGHHKVEVRVVENRGRDVSALLIGLRDAAKYDYVCFFHDKKVLQTKPGSVGMGFAFLCTENLFGSPPFVLNMVRLLADNPRLGFLAPPPPNHADYFFTLGLNWGPNWSNTRALYDKLGMSSPIAEDKMPLAALGTCFWFRGAALKTLLDRPWKYEDFPPEPNNTDGTLLHAMERIYSFVAQDAGYYPAYVYSDRFAALQYSTFRHYVRGYQQVMVKNGIMNKQQVMCRLAQERLEPEH